MEPGTQRLTSYRQPRDLTLGGNIKSEKPKKVYIPNLNVQRNKKKDEVTPVKVDAPRPKDRDRGRGRGRGDGRQGRGDKGHIIQSAGIWSEGIFTPTVSRKSNGPRSSSSSSGRGAEKYLERSKLDMNKIINKSEEDKLKDILRDDFIDDGTNTDNKMAPILLPRVEKEEPSDEEIDKKPIISENGEVINIKEETLSEQNKKEVTINQIIENKTYILMQFPDCWQDVESSKEDSNPKGPNDSNTYSENDNKAKTEQCALNSLKSGLLGKLEILKSGKARLRIGEKCFSIDINVQQDFKQELLAAKVDNVSLTGDLIKLGPVKNQLFCSPDLETMLENS